MMRIVCFGDSNTWGFSPMGRRIDEKDIYVGILREVLGYEVVNAGECGRTTNALYALKNALYIPSDLTIIMLGTNDLQITCGYSLDEIENNMRHLLEYAGKNTLLVMPPYIHYESVVDWPYRKDVIEECKALEKLYENLAREYDIEILSLKDQCEMSFDGIHLSVAGHHTLASLLIKKIKEMSIWK